MQKNPTIFTVYVNKFIAGPQSCFKSTVSKQNNNNSFQRALLEAIAIDRQQDIALQWCRSILHSAVGPIVLSENSHKRRGIAPRV